MSHQQNTNDNFHSPEASTDSVAEQQSEGTNAIAVIREVVDGSTPTTLEANAADPSRSGKCLDPRPRIKLPGDDRLTSVVASEYGHVLAACDYYSFAGVAAIYDRTGNTLRPISPAGFRTHSERYVLPVKEKEEGEVVQSITAGDARTVLLSGQFLDQLPEVERINGVCLPVMRASGEVELLRKGYDQESKIFTVYESLEYSTVMPVTEARAFLDNLWKDFPFADAKKSKAIVLAAMLTLYGLDLMPRKTLAPVFLYLANLPGLGKGLLAQLAMVSVLGYAPTGVLPKDEAEMRKLLFATAKEGRAAVFLDNVTGRLASPALESFITTTLVSGRVLGSSTTLACRKNSVVFVTGNNLSLNGDMARRSLTVELFLTGDPADRPIEDPLDEDRLLEVRPKTLAALYALVRDWTEAGKPVANKTNTNFEVWSRIIGGIVERAGYGPVATTAAMRAMPDASDADMAVLAEKIYGEHQAAAITFVELVDVARTHGLFSRTLASDAMQPRQANTAFGRFLGSRDQHVFGDGLRFVIIGTGHARRYAFRRLESLAAA